MGLRGDRGSATVWAVMALAAVGAVFAGVLALGQAVQLRHRAGGAADLAALAAAGQWTKGTAQACAVAERVARAQGARVVRCAVRGEVAEVTAGAGSGVLATEVRARAGPAGAVPAASGTGPVAGLEPETEAATATGAATGTGTGAATGSDPATGTGTGTGTSTGTATFTGAATGTRPVPLPR